MPKRVIAHAGMQTGVERLCEGESLVAGSCGVPSNDAVMPNLSPS